MKEEKKERHGKNEQMKNAFTSLNDKTTKQSTKANEYKGKDERGAPQRNVEK